MNSQSASQFRLLSSPGVICLLLAVAVLAVYLPVRNFGFVDYDDTAYFFENPHVLGGFSTENVKWAFTTGEAANWHPFTWLSLMLDAQLFGSGAFGPHLTNVFLHLVNSILIFVLLRRLTANLWRSAAVAMLFAVHPLHVESVAWVAERKDVLSGFFGLLTLLCYTRYAAGDGSTQRRGFASPFYWLSLVLFACGLMSKPMLVTMPFVLLLLDFWPLRRFKNEPLRRLLVEKIPFFFLSIASSVVTFIVQKKGGAVSTLTLLPMSARLENAFVSYARYLGKIFWPVNLATPYPSPHYWTVLIVLLSVALFAAICVAAVVLMKKYPFLFTGWFWFAGMLVPVIGLVQVGGQAMADRYVYLPLMGILVIVVWGAGEICGKYRVPRRSVGIVAAIVCFACAVRARNQVSVWENDGTLFGHALAVTRDNYVASVNLGTWYSKSGDVKGALNCYYNALRMNPNDPSVLYDVGDAFAKLGHFDEAISVYRHALEITPNQADILNNLGFALAQNHQLPEATTCFQEVLKLKPDSAEAHNNLATILFMQGNVEQAAKEYEAAVQLTPNDPQMLANLGDALVRLGRPKDAIQYYMRALQLEPNNARLRSKLQSLGIQTSD